MKLKTPTFGPFAGQLCRVTPDGLELAAPPSDGGSLVVALPSGGASGGGGGSGGEIGWADTRDNIAKFARTLEDSGFSDAQSRAKTIALRWDRSVRQGHIKRPGRS